MTLIQFPPRPLSVPQEDDDGPLAAPEYDTISENGLLSRNEPIRSKVSKLTERLRKRYPTSSTGEFPSGQTLSVDASVKPLVPRRKLLELQRRLLSAEEKGETALMFL